MTTTTTEITFRKGEKVRENRQDARVETVIYVCHPMVYTDKNPIGGYHCTKIIRG